MEPAISARISEFRYVSATFPALSNIEFTIDPGEFVLITGPAGSGKTTLCLCLTGVIPKMVKGGFAGEVEIDGTSLSGLPLPRVSPLLGLVMQSPENQLFNVTVAEDVAFGPENLRLLPDEVARRVQAALEFTTTTHLAHRFSHELSGGESQRVVVSSVLAIGAGILVCDQPAAELDPAGRRTIYENIYRLNREGQKTVILVEDRLSEVAAYASRIILLDGGRIVRDLPPREFFADRSVAEHGIRVPEVVDLYHRLSDAGVQLNAIPLGPAEAARELGTYLANGAAAGAVAAPVPESPLSSTTAGSREPAIEVVDVAHRYPTGTDALTGVDLSVVRGEFVAIVGENGAGKTTLAKHLVGLLRPTRGVVRILGRDIARRPVHEISRSVGFLFQDPDYQIFNNTCLDEVGYGLRLRPGEHAEWRGEAATALQEVGLADLADAHPYTLSRGQRQRLAFTSVLALRPDVLIVDEPTTGLDYRESLLMMSRLGDYQRQGGTVVIITHDVELAAKFAQRVIVMSRGRIVFDAPASRLGDRLEVLAQAGVVLPDLALLVQGLGLPASVRTVADLVAAVADSSLRQKPGGGDGAA